ncbi:MAG: hypothetical protein EBV77_01635 [Gemmatimonadaceae bacterium]|nr:hypothetical protein [Gemmatimonadaceae bacterium]
MPTGAARTRSFSRIPSTPNRRPWAKWASGKSSGSGTAFAASSYGGADARSCGAVAKSCWRAGSPRWSRAPNGSPIRQAEHRPNLFARHRARAVHISMRDGLIQNGQAIAHRAFGPMLDVADWATVRASRSDSRREHAEGLMLKRRSSPYGVGRRAGDWYKWKVNPLTVDAVLVYAQAGHGRRAGLFTDYTFAIRDGEALVPFAKAYSGLTDAEIRQVDKFVRNNTLEKFGPVRTVKPELVFELAFEGIQRSTRHKSGIAVRFPRIARWRQDKPAHEADTLDTVKALLDA